MCFWNNFSRGYYFPYLKLFVLGFKHMYRAEGRIWGVEVCIIGLWSGKGLYAFGMVGHDMETRRAIDSR